MAETVGNADVDWNVSKKAHEGYISSNYREITHEDRILNATLIAALGQLPAILGRPLFNQLEHGAHVGAGGVLIDSALMAPLFKDEGIIQLGDVGRAQLQITQEAIDDVRNGNNGIWQPHEELMTECDRRWEGSFGKAASLGRVAYQDVFNLPKGEFQIVTMPFVVESNTKEEEEFEAGMDSCIESVEPNGGIIIGKHTAESDGWDDDGAKPAFSVAEERIRRGHSRRGAHVVACIFTQASKMARIPGDGHDYSGMITSLSYMKDPKSTTYIT